MKNNYFGLKFCSFNFIKIFGFVLAAVFIFGGFFAPNFVLAARTITSATLNGASNVTVKSGDSITATVTVQVTNASDPWGSTRYRFGTKNWICVANISNHPTGTTATEIFSIIAPLTAGTYDVSFDARSGNTCDGGDPNSIILISGIIVNNIPPLSNQSTLTVTGLPASATYGQVGIVAGTSGGSGTGAVSFSAGASTACSVNATTGAVSIISGTGNCIITAAKAGDSNYNPITSAPISITVGKSNQTISFGVLPDKIYGDADFSVTATANSGLPVAFSSSSSGICSVSGDTVHIIGVGVCAITASQTGDTNYNPAPDVLQTFTINKRNLIVTATGVNKVYDANVAATVTLGSNTIESDNLTFAYTAVFDDPNVGAGKAVHVSGIAISGGTNASNYNLLNTTAETTASITRSSVVISLDKTNLTKVYNGSTQSVGVSTDPSGLANSVTYNGSAVAPTSAGSYSVFATVTDPNYAGTDSATLIISKVDPIVSWANPADIVFGAALGGAQLNAASRTPGALVYNPVSGTVLPVGAEQVLSTLFTPTDSANYNSTTTTVLVNVLPVPTLTGIAITTPASKLSYTVGDALDLTGLVVTGKYSDGNTQVEVVEVADVAGFDSSASATGQVLTITYDGQTTTYAVNIVAAPVVSLPPPPTPAPSGGNGPIVGSYENSSGGEGGGTIIQSPKISGDISGDSSKNEIAGTGGTNLTPTVVTPIAAPDQVVKQIATQAPVSESVGTSGNLGTETQSVSAMSASEQSTSNLQLAAAIVATQNSGGAWFWFWLTVILIVICVVIYFLLKRKKQL